MNKLKCLSISVFQDCNLSCPGCYVHRVSLCKKEDQKPLCWFLGLPRYISKIAEQCALGGGEVLLQPGFVKRFGKECRKHNLIFNITTNGTFIRTVPKDTFKDITMVSISFDKHKIKNAKDVSDYRANIAYLKGLKKQVGCNLLLDEFIIKHLLGVIKDIFSWGVDRVFCLVPKTFKQDKKIHKLIIKNKVKFQALSMLYKHFYVDDCLNRIITDGLKWNEPCHYGKGLLSLKWDGGVYGCSFDGKSAMMLREPKDVSKAVKLKLKERMKCPYL